jgi:hypothetical protein
MCTVLCALEFAPSAGFCQTYTTTFDGTENPLSEGGRWSNNGLDWTNIRKGNGIAYSTQSGTESGKFKDSNRKEGTRGGCQEAATPAMRTAEAQLCHLL